MDGSGNRRGALARLLALAGVATAAPAVAATAPRGMVVQVTAGESARWNGVLGNVRNLRAEAATKAVPITVVAIGPALGMLTDDSLAANAVQDAQAAGVLFVACGNSMQAQHIDPELLLPGVTRVAAGYAEIHRLQQAGWTYLVP